MSNKDDDEEEKLECVDISAEVFGKFQFCTMRDGLWYADSDFEFFGVGDLKEGALPRPWGQPTPELTEKARRMNEEAARKLVEAAIPTRARKEDRSTKLRTWREFFRL